MRRSAPKFWIVKESQTFLIKMLYNSKKVVMIKNRKGQFIQGIIIESTRIISTVEKKERVRCLMILSLALEWIMTVKTL